MTNDRKGSVWFLIIFGIGITFLIYFEVYKKDTLYYLNKGYTGLINTEFNGIIIDKKVDRSDHNNNILIFKSGNKLKGLNGFFWGKMQVGDSISKVEGDTIIQVFRNGEKIILEIAPFYEKGIENAIEKKKDKKEKLKNKLTPSWHKNPLLVYIPYRQSRVPYQLSFIRKIQFKNNHILSSKTLYLLL